jgi:tetratricopeptide (TPR) repeat protein
MKKSTTLLTAMKSLLIWGVFWGWGVSPMVLTLAVPSAVVAASLQDQAKSYNDQGIQFFQGNKFTEAALMFNIAVELEPGNSQYHFNLGYVNFKGLDNYTVALKHLDRAIQLKPSFTEAYATRAYVKLKLSDYRGSLADYDKVIADSPQAAAMWQERAILKHSYLKDLPGALRDYDRAIELSPNDAMNYGFRGLVKRDLGQREGAIADFRKGLAMARNQNNGDLVATMQGNLRGLGASE